MLAVELIDPITLELLSKKVSLTATGLVGQPRVNFSGRFVWLVEGDNWPSAFVFDPGSLPYDAATYTAMAKPTDIANATPAQRLLRVALRPNAAYPFADGVTVVRGRLRETAVAGAAAVVGAQVFLAWYNGKTLVDSVNQAQANQAGDFACFLRLPTSARPTVDKNRNLELRIVVVRGTDRREQPVKVPDGRIYDLPDALAWSAMTST